MSKNPHEQDMAHVELLCQSLTADLAMLDTVQQSLSRTETPNISQDDDPSAFDDLDNETPVVGRTPAPETCSPPTSSLEEGVPVQNRQLAMPSTCNVLSQLDCTIELNLRRRQAVRHLNALCSAIAEKSFQYSHVICVAPQKSVRTHARSTIIKLNE